MSVQAIHVTVSHYIRLTEQKILYKNTKYFLQKNSYKTNIHPKKSQTVLTKYKILLTKKYFLQSKKIILAKQKYILNNQRFFLQIQNTT